jgi:hypothetical protein
MDFVTIAKPKHDDNDDDNNGQPHYYMEGSSFKQA